MSMDNQAQKAKDSAKKLLADGTVKTVIGYADEGVDGLCVPVFITDVKDADRLVWTRRSVPNLASYLIGRKEKTAIIAKSCDVRAIVNLVVENQVKRDDVYIIGMDCPGMTDPTGAVLHACKDCRVNTPPVFDERIENADVKPVATPDSKNAERGLDENLARFTKEMEKCILCFSCRQACYGCYCQTCFMDRGVPDWHPESPDMGAKMLYHLGRAMHLAGRCVECGACENACASGVDVRYLIREVTGFVNELYGYDAGLSLDEESAMLTYKPDDREVGFLGGETHA
ncbi:Fe-S oxidoreductase [Synergistales bacterium]|nr:Fe-S oxidoreductase [Synergistales bacterium]